MAKYIEPEWVSAESFHSNTQLHAVLFRMYSARMYIRKYIRKTAANTIFNLHIHLSTLLLLFLAVAAIFLAF